MVHLTSLSEKNAVGRPVTNGVGQIKIKEKIVCKWKGRSSF